jgi:hypothetical protein
MGFIYPFIGLICFFLPVCMPPEVVTRKSLNDFAVESDKEYEMEEQARRTKVLEQRRIMKEMAAEEKASYAN